MRRLSTTAHRSAEMASQIDKSNQYGVQLAKTQRHVNGFVGGEGRLNQSWNRSANGAQPLEILPSSASSSYPTKQAARY